ncbi:MAG: ABC transporter ATP-binding protein [Deltaproteobacteria bacterium]|nr:ABC transporter ATP-binding protein [Deltaproteobacteria bacterium]
MGFQIKKMSFSYGDNKVIDNVSLHIEPGRFYGIIGPNGCGKSTFLDLLSSHTKPAAGSVFFMGKDLAKYSKKALSRLIALVPQNFYINFSFTAREIVLMGRYPHIPKFSVPAQQDMEIIDDVMQKTETYQFKNRFITELSGGERQRVVFARALAQDTDVLILDEATSNFDINHSIRMLNLAARGVEKNGKTVITVLQDINLAAIFCEYLIFIKNGRIAAYGKTNEVLNANTIKSVFNVDAKVYQDSYSNSKQVVFKR